MKNKLKSLGISLLGVAVLILCTIGCSKSDELSVHETSTPEVIQKTGLSHYFPETCELENGGVGSRCANSSNDACWESTSCKSNPKRVSDYLALNYSESELRQMALHPVPITDNYVLSVLKEERILPLK